MSLISSGIAKVRVFELSGGIWSEGRSVAEVRTDLVKWRSAWSDKFYQVYVNGRYAGATLGAAQRQMIVQVPTFSGTPVRIEVFAVSAAEAETDFSIELESSRYNTGRVKIKLLRSQALPIGATAKIYFDNGTGEIDYNNSLNVSPIRIWPVWQDKAGFGMSGFGVGDFGFDGAAAVGFGRGNFGGGQFGLDADVIEWISGPLQAGVYKFAVKVSDKFGKQSLASETGQITVTPAARPAERVSVSSFDKNINELVLSIS